MSEKKFHVAAIDDDPAHLLDIQHRLGAAFAFHGFQTSHDLIAQMTKTPFDLFLVDVHMPIENGFVVADKILRSEHYAGGSLLFVTYDRSLATIDRCLAETGADYVHRDALATELVPRINRLLDARSKRVLRLGELEVNPENISASLLGQPLVLTLIEFKILSFLLTRHDRIVHRDYLQRYVWGASFVADKTLNSHLFNLRLKLSPAMLTLQVDRKGIVALNAKTSS